jgi:L-amino acid N-acyltransferase YncA
MSTYKPRQALGADLSAIHDIMNEYIATSTATYITEPQTYEDRLKWFEQRSEKHPAVVVEQNGRIVAFGALSTHRPRDGYGHTAETSIYVHRDFHRRGIGSVIMADLIRRARAAGLHVLIGVCCSESVASIALLESLGFKRVGYLPQVGRKFNRWLDNVYLHLLLT